MKIFGRVEMLMIENETDLYSPVKVFLEDSGYEVRGEVAHCDVVALKDGEMIAVELKKSMNLELILQGVDRQKSADSVYVAVPRPDNFVKDKKWRRILHLLRRLELGLIFVSPRGGVDIVHHAVVFDREKSRKLNAKKRKVIIAEHSSRSYDGNTGGCTRRKLMTAYRESCIHTASILMKLNDASPKELVALGSDGKKTSSILSKNFYGWFDRVCKGRYCLNDKGRKEAAEYIKKEKRLRRAAKVIRD